MHYIYYICMCVQVAHVKASPVFKHTHQEKILGVLEIYQQYMISDDLTFRIIIIIIIIISYSN